MLAAGDALPKVKEADVNQLGHEVGGHGGEDDADGVPEDHVVGVVVHFREGQCGQQSAQPDDQQDE